MSSSGTLIVVGAEGLDQARSVEYYNPEIDEWIKILNLNVDRVEFKSIMYEGKLALTGGLKDKSYSTAVQTYDYATGTMASLSSFKHPRALHGIAVLARHLYVIGGYDGNYTNSAERHNPLTDTWTDILPLQTARGSAGTVILDDEIYVIGGYNLTDHHMATVESYNLITEKWRYCASMNDKREHPAVAVIGSSIYAVAGKVDKVVLNTAERYEPQIDRWTFIHPVSVSRFRSEGIFFNDSLIVTGGKTASDQSLSVVDSHNAKNNTWVTKNSLLTARAFFSLVEVPWKLF